MLAPKNNDTATTRLQTFCVFIRTEGRGKNGRRTSGIFPHSCS
jgi:hypothetical protein